MTIIYQFRVATTTLGGFLKLLYAWKGSVYKLLYKELLIFITLYACVSLVYRFALTEDQKLFFESIVEHLYNSSSAIPLSFVLGFYVTFIVQRWWQQFSNVPWPDRTLFTMSAYLHGFDDRARMMRRSVARYMMFGMIWICRAISVAVMKRFPTLDHIVDAGFITKEEKVMFENTECKYQKFFVPLMWANQILVTARRENKIESDFGLRMIVEPLADFRDKCSLCFVYDWITVPLVYTQVVTFAVYSYFGVSLFGQQYLDPAKNYKGFELDFYIPGFTILQFLFYMGWLKVAEQMINPFGEDDDDFDINWLLDRHTGVAFSLVDQCYGKYPTLVKDGLWNDVAPDIPYTESSARSMRPNFLGSTFNIAPSQQDKEKRLIRDQDYINQHEWSQRNRRRHSVSGSLLTLYPFKNLWQQRDTLSAGSNGSFQSRTMANGKVFLYVLNKGDEVEGRTRWSSAEIPVNDNASDDGEEFQLRERANTDSDFRDVSDRKLSLPFIFNPFTKSKQKKVEPDPPSASPKINRFTLEPVKDQPAQNTDNSSANKTRRTGHSSIPFQNVVSRIPMLSAIKETLTVTSLSQLVTQSSVTEKPDLDDVIEKNNENRALSFDDSSYEDDISYVDETSSLMTNDEISPSPSPILSPKTFITSPAKTIPSSSPSKITTTDNAPSSVAVTKLATMHSTSKDRKNSTVLFASKLSPRPMLKSAAVKPARKDSTALLMTPPEVPSPPSTVGNLHFLPGIRKKSDSRDGRNSNHNSPKSLPKSKNLFGPSIDPDDL